MTISIMIVGFQSTPPVKAATTFVAAKKRLYDISIHAAREGGDAVLAAYGIRTDISIHAAREGGDLGLFFDAYI